jgi:hypothetical protein
MKSREKLLFCITLFLLSRSVFPFTVGNKMEGALVVVKSSLKVAHRHLNLSGHEEITRQAIILAKKAADQNHIPISKEITEMAFKNLQPDKFGLIGSEATNPLIQGNYATDFPFTRNDYAVNLPDFWKFHDVRSDMDWQNHPRSQQFHFLRNHLAKPDSQGSILVGQKQSCYSTRNAIIAVTREASLLLRRKTDVNGKILSKALRQANLRKSLFFVGHATHMLQDSFSEAHGKRKARKNNHDLSEMCYFGFDTDIIENPTTHSTRLNSCHHSLDEIVRDGLWVKDYKGINRVKREWPDEPVVEESLSGVYTCMKNFTLKLTDNETCLKHTPRLARTATAKYLIVLINYMKFDDVTISKKDHLKNYLVENLFEGSLRLQGLDETMPDGVMRCNNLPE